MPTSTQQSVLNAPSLYGRVWESLLLPHYELVGGSVGHFIAVLYNIYQDSRQYLDKTAKTQNQNYEKYLARAVHVGAKTTEDLAKEVSY